MQSNPWSLLTRARWKALTLSFRNFNARTSTKEMVKMNTSDEIKHKTKWNTDNLNLVQKLSESFIFGSESMHSFSHGIHCTTWVWKQSLYSGHWFTYNHPCNNLIPFSKKSPLTSFQNLYFMDLLIYHTSFFTNGSFQMIGVQYTKTICKIMHSLNEKHFYLLQTLIKLSSK